MGQLGSVWIIGICMEYPMPMADVLVDGAAHKQMLYFMDGNAGYNQIMVVEKDIHKTAFMCPGHIGAFEYIVMPFGLRNAGAIYQRAMNFVFHDMIGHSLEVYIDDVVIKSPEEGDHVSNLRNAFLRMRQHKLKMNPKKFVPQKVVKGQAIADFLANHPGEEIENMDSLDIANADLLTRAHTFLNNPIYSVHLTPWKLYFDRSKTDVTSGARIILEEPVGIRRCYSF
ncbi:hypothetical protein L3X38_032897 [Prunus dulcis]|uniref:Reverse transcriptase domain-containing protein n=1 Tax=Prunus dulcis TaxID=3755 RepID=A0AAD4VGC3_PRUDU|nr:hypothetical protein L3X38_032897 [Prunus dulcis]